MITKEILDNCYDKVFDMHRFKNIDPLGIVYELTEHTESQLDIELGALFVAMISWGRRQNIRNAAYKMIRDEMNWHPAEFILTRKFETSFKTANKNCVYRTLHVPAFKQVCENIYQVMIMNNITDDNYHTLEWYFKPNTTAEVIEIICGWLKPARLGTPNKSACKRICMFIRWMTRNSFPDLGCWSLTRNQNDLYAVMDLHVMELTQDILKNKKANWKSCVELTNIFKTWDSEDPLKYDIALMTYADNIQN